jgi:hypothetical protein
VIFVKQNKISDIYLEVHEILLSFSEIHNFNSVKMYSDLLSTLLADTTSEGFNDWVLISFTESPCPTKL